MQYTVLKYLLLTYQILTTFKLYGWRKQIGYLFKVSWFTPYFNMIWICRIHPGKNWWQELQYGFCILIKFFQGICMPWIFQIPLFYEWITDKNKQQTRLWSQIPRLKFTCIAILWFSNLNMHMNHPGNLVKMQISESRMRPGILHF